MTRRAARVAPPADDEPAHDPRMPDTHYGVETALLVLVLVAALIVCLLLIP